MSPIPKRLEGAEEDPKPPSKKLKKVFSYPALLITQNQHRFYFSTIPVDDVFPCCFVARRDEEPITGFQRNLNESRADDIAAYLVKGRGSIPSNIVLSAQETANFSYNRKTKSISFARVPRAFLVLDGQHRLWGYQKCSQRHRVPVAIYEGLSRAEEARLFIDINTNQRGVPAALLLDIKHLAEIESSREQILREMFDKLQQDAKSPLAGKLSATKSLSGRISRVTFNKALSTAIGSGILFEADGPTRYKLVRNYLNAFDAELPDKKLLQKSAFFEAIFEAIDEVVRNTMALHGDAKQESIQRVIRPLATLDFGKGAVGKALPSKKAIVALMQTALRKNLPISEELL